MKKSPLANFIFFGILRYGLPKYDAALHERKPKKLTKTFIQTSHLIPIAKTRKIHSTPPSNSAILPHTELSETSRQHTKENVEEHILNKADVQKMDKDKQGPNPSRYTARRIPNRQPTNPRTHSSHRKTNQIGELQSNPPLTKNPILKNNSPDGSNDSQQYNGKAN